jgi:hypothetical protein
MRFIVSLNNPFTIGWLCWFAFFAVWEGITLFNSKPGDTLSEHVWRWFGTRREDYKGDKTPPRLGRFILLAFMAWLSIHFLTGGVF